MNKYYIPLGEECYTCQSLDSKFNSNSMRKSAFPFDYVGHVFIEKIYDNLFDLFNNSNKNLDLSDYIKCEFDNQNNEKLFFTNKKYEFKYWHDELHKNSIDFDSNNFIEKYNRRYDRLYDIIKNLNSITFLSVNHFDNIYINKTKENEVLKLYNLLFSINNNITFIAVNYNDKNYKYNTLEFVNLPVNRNISFMESKNLFTKNLYEYVNSNFK